MKKLTVWMLLLAMLFSFSSCSNGESEHTIPVTNESISNSYEELTSTITTEDSSREPSESSVPPIDVLPDDKTRIKILHGEDFSDGFAWVTVDAGKEYANPCGILDTSGKVIIPSFYQENEYISYGSPFDSGYSYLNYNNKFVIFNTDGDTVVNSPDDGSYYTILAGGDGVYLVYQQIRTMNESEDRYGFIDVSGKWVVKPAVESPFGDIFTLDNVYSDNQLSFYYLGEHVFLARNTYRDYFSYYNVDLEKKIVYLTDFDDLTSSSVFGNGYDEPYYMFTNGKTLYGENISYGLSLLYPVYANCEDIQLEFELPEDTSPIDCVYHDGMIFIGKKKWVNGSSLNYSPHVFEEGAFYDLDFNKVIDFSSYRAVILKTPGFYKFYNGSAPVLIFGADERYYISHIDLNGNFIYEPIKVDAWSMAQDGIVYIDYVRYGDNVEVHKDILHPDGTTYPMPEEIDIDTQYEIAEFVFCDGYAWCDDEGLYVSDKGEILKTYSEN